MPINFNTLENYAPRSFVAENDDFTRLEVIQPYYQKLLEMKIDSSEALEQWILHRSEMDSVSDQAGSILYIEMTCQTDDESKTKAYQDYMQNVVPAIKPLEDKLNRKFLAALEGHPLDEERYGVYIREIKADVELFRQDNVELETKVAMLSQQYQSVIGAQTVEFDGQERTMQQMGKYLLELDRGLRERAWRAVYERRQKDTKVLDDIFDQMVKLRHQIAINAGFENYAQYKFRALHRFDYTIEDCKAYHATVEECLMPLYRKLVARHKELLGLDELKPWDLSVDPLGRPPLKPFKETPELIEGVGRIFEQVDQELSALYVDMKKTGLLDLDSRKGKAPGGYQSTLAEARKPFIFMNAVGVNGDVNTLLHESGHAFHSLLCAHDTIADYRHAPIEFCEVASMGMELLSGEHLSEFYSEDDCRRAKADHIEDIVFVLLWVATIDAFQHWIYENPEHTAEERKVQWLKILNRFGAGLTNWDGFESARDYMWHKQLHVFEVPFYYIEYGIAQLGALQLWMNSKNDYAKALDEYKAGLTLGGSRPLPDLFKKAGLNFDFKKETIAPLTEVLESELSKADVTV